MDCSASADHCPISLCHSLAADDDQPDADAADHDDQPVADAAADDDQPVADDAAVGIAGTAGVSESRPPSPLE